MMALKFIFAIFAGLILLPTKASAIDIQPIGTESSEIAMVLAGEIEPGDDEKLSEYFQAAQNQKLPISFVNLNSPGGLVSVGAGMARLIRNQQLKTRVKAGSTCASSCFMLFAAGKERYAEPGARIGVHSAVHQRLGETRDAKSTTIDMVRFLSELGVPPSIVGKVVTTKPDQITWLTTEDLRSMQVRGAPAITPSESYIEKASPRLPTPTGAVSVEDQQRARSLLVQSNLSLRIGNNQAALELAEQAGKINPYDVNILSAYGYALYLNGKYEAARDKTLLAIRISPTFASLYRVLAFSSASLSDEAAAYEGLTKYYRYSTNKDLVLTELNSIIGAKNSEPILRSAARRTIERVGQ
jgi:hypothetical protein